MEHKSVFAEAIEPAEVISIFSKEINFSVPQVLPCGVTITETELPVSKISLLLKVLVLELLL